MKLQDALNILGLNIGATQEEIKKAYKAAAKKYHPNIHPAGFHMMKFLNSAYEALDGYDGAEPRGYKKEIDYSSKLWAALKVISELNVNIEICGSWIWVTGEVYRLSIQLQGAGFKYASNKNAWYFRPETHKSRGRGGWTMNEIRDSYGSDVLQIEEDEEENEKDMVEKEEDGDEAA